MADERLGLASIVDLAPPFGHEYQFNLDLPQGAEALQRMVAFLRRTLP